MGLSVYACLNGTQASPSSCSCMRSENDQSQEHVLLRHDEVESLFFISESFLHLFVTYRMSQSQTGQSGSALRFREYSFLNNSRVPAEILEESVTVTLCEVKWSFLTSSDE